MSAKITGLDAFKRRIADASAFRGMVQSADEASSVIRAAAERRLTDIAPLEANEIAASLSVETASGGSIVRLQTDSPRGAAIEFGTSKSAARPWLEPALAASRKTIAAAFARWLQSTIKGARP